MHVALLNALDLRLRAAEIVVVGSGPPAEDLFSAALKLPFLDRVVLRARAPAALPGSHPAQDQIRAASGPAAFICVGEKCSLPVTRSQQMVETLNAIRS
jgi:hypothetical protein